MKRQAEQAESDSNRKFTVEDAIRTAAFVVAMSCGITIRKDKAAFHE